MLPVVIDQDVKRYFSTGLNSDSSRVQGVLYIDEYGLFLESPQGDDLRRILDQAKVYRHRELPSK